MDESLARIVLIRYKILNIINKDRVKLVRPLSNDAGAFGDSNTREECISSSIPSLCRYDGKKQLCRMHSTSASTSILS